MLIAVKGKEGLLCSQRTDRLEALLVLWTTYYKVGLSYGLYLMVLNRFVQVAHILVKIEMRGK